MGKDRCRFCRKTLGSCICVSDDFGIDLSDPFGY
jgi:hypothetical protein